MQANFDTLIKDAEGNSKQGDPVSKWMVQYLEAYNDYEPGDKAMMWSLLGEIRRKGEVELNEEELAIIKKYWKRINPRLDVDMEIRRILDIEE